jgi:hypothetical protein
MMYGFPNAYGPSMAGSENAMGFMQPFAFRHPMLGGGLPPQSMPMRTGGGLPPMQQGNTGIVPPNILSGGGLPPQQMPMVRTGGYDAPQQQMPQNRLAGFGGGYNFGLGGYLR